MITMERMLLSSVHMGHFVKKWNPKMSPYIFVEKKGRHIIDILQTLLYMRKVCTFLKKETKKGKKRG